VLGVLSIILFVQGAGAIKESSLYLGLSTLSHGLTKTTNSSSGDTTFLGPMYYPLILQSALSVGSNWKFAPFLGYTLLTRNSPEGGEKTSYLILGLPFSDGLGGDGRTGFDWTVGPVLLMYTIQGTGGTARLSNGNSTATFGLPGNSQTSRTWALDLGLGYNTSTVRIGLDTLTEAVLSNSRRTFSLMLSICYNFLGG
jgi:hypothetical protein